MKKFFYSILAICVLVIPAANIVNFLVKNNLNSKDSISEILYPDRGWPEQTKKELSIWNFLYQDTTNRVMIWNNKMVNDYSNFYLQEYHKNHDVPSQDLDNYVKNNIALSHDMQVYQALSLRSYFIEYVINKIRYPGRHFINEDENLNLWVMKYFNAGFYYQWVKIWIQDQATTIEEAINIDFYTFGKLVPKDKITGQDDYSSPPISKTVVPELHLVSLMEQMINQLYSQVLAKK